MSMTIATQGFLKLDLAWICLEYGDRSLLEQGDEVPVEVI